MTKVWYNNIYKKFFINNEYKLNYEMKEGKTKSNAKI